MNRISYLLFSLLLFFNITGFAQMPDGATAPNWTLNDINGNSHTLYNYLDAGQPVIIDFSATWCGYCWNYHNTHILSDMWNQYGPNATNEIQVFFIESDPSTNTNCLYGTSGCSGGTWGNWVAGTPFPIIDLQTSTVRVQYQVAYYPTLYIIAPNRKIYEVGQASFNTWVNRKNSALLNATASITHPDCGGQNNGSIDLQPANGYGPLSFSWSNGAITEDVNNLAEGSYYVTISDIYGHAVEKGPFELIEPDEIQVNTQSVDDVSCNGYADGAIAVFAQGGSGSYNYFWSNGQYGPSISNLQPGTYGLTVEDATGCIKTATYSISEPPVLELILSSEDENCNSGDGSITAYANGGTPPYLYDFGSGWTSANQANQLPAGTYQVTLSDENYCETYQYVDIGAIPGPTADAGDGGTLNCNTNYLILDGTGSTGPGNLTFEWYTPDGYIAYGESSPNPRIEAAGTYYLTVTTQGTICTDEAAVSIPIDTVSPTASIATPAPLTCTIQSMQLDGTGSSAGPDFVYYWSTPDGNIVSGGQTNQPTIDAAGAYYFEVSNTSNGCSKITQVSVDQTPPVALTVSQSTDVSCNGGEDGFIEVQAIAGQGPYNFSWSNGANGASLENVSAGTYTVTATDANNCIDELSFTIQQPDPVQGNPVIQHETSFEANDGSVILNPIGGNGPFTVAWNNGNTGLSQNGLSPGEYIATITDANNCEKETTITVNPFNCDLTAISNQSDVSCFGNADGSIALNVTGSGSQHNYNWSNGDNTAFINNLSAGTYEVSISDEFNCTIVQTITIEQPAPLSIDTTNLSNISCFEAADGAIAIMANGGTPGYNYTWNTGAETPDLENLAPGTYTLQVTDDNNCTVSYDFTFIAPEKLEVQTIAAENVVCKDDSTGSISLAITGGTPGYQIDWAHGQSGPALTGLPTGIYTANIQDANGCTEEHTIAIEAHDTIAPVALAKSGTFELGTDGTIQIAAAAIDDSSYDNCSPVQLSIDKSNFTCDDIGTHAITLSVLDDAGNRNSTTAEIEIVDRLAPTVTCPEKTVFTNCPETVSYAPPAFEDNCSIAYVELIEGPATGSNFPMGVTSITYRATDIAGNTTNCTFEIELQNTLEVREEHTDVSCFGYSDGQINLVTGGGNPGYTYQWDDDNQSTDASLADLAPGTYTCIITDNAGCTKETSITIDEPEMLLADVESVVRPSQDQENGSINVIITGGTGMYAYEWSLQGNPDFYATDKDLEDIGPGIYKLVVTDENGCSVLIEIRVDATVSLKNKHISKDFSIFPNPSAGIVQISTAGLSREFDFLVLDVRGSVVEKGQIVIAPGHPVNLNLPHLADGLYTVRLAGKEAVAVLPVQIQKTD